GALRAANSFASAEGDEVITHARVIPEMRHRRCIRGGIVERGNLVFFGKFDPFIDFDLPGGVLEIAEVHHGRFWIYRFPEIVAGFDFDQLHASRTELMVEAI